MALVYGPELRKSIIKRRSGTGWNVQQFGQAGDESTYNGATGCTHTVLQWLAYLWLNKKYTQNQISNITGYPWPSRNPKRRGLNYTEVQRFCSYTGLPYRVQLGLSAPQVAEASRKGPVAFGHKYGWWPDWYKYRLGGSATDGRPNGFASPRGEAGKTQSTWDGAHFGLLLGVARDPNAPDVFYCWEPNHGSPARPEKPAYDKLTSQQFVNVYNSYQKSLGRTPYALVPTKTLPSGGY